MVGLDIDRAALSIARNQRQPGAEYIQEDMRRSGQIPGKFDAVLSIWQSFGYFDELTNQQLIGQISQKLTPNGRLILDIYNREYWQRNQGERKVERKAQTIQIIQSMQGNRLTVRLNYPGGDSDAFEWQLYSLQEIEYIARGYGLKSILACTEYDEGKSVTANKPQMQIVFELEAYG